MPVPFAQFLAAFYPENSRLESLPSRELTELKKLYEQAPEVLDLDRKVLAAIEKPKALCMDFWHSKEDPNYDPEDYHKDESPPANPGFYPVTPSEKEAYGCDTAHCLAGWACVYGGDPKLDSKVGTANLGRAIFVKSTGSAPKFFCTNDEALAEMRARVAALDAVGQ